MRPASRLIVLIAMALSVAACSNKGLHDFTDASAGPEEFAILPTKPLESPKSFAALPVPTPGSSNLVDPTPKQDAIAALGGKPSRLADKGIPSSDSALVASASRYGVPGNIRQTTTAEDAEYRKRRGRFTNIRLFKTDRYAQVYKRESLDAHKTLNAYRRASRATPTAPPAN